MRIPTATNCHSATGVACAIGVGVKSARLVGAEDRWVLTPTFATLRMMSPPSRRSFTERSRSTVLGGTAFGIR
jgi:hypothetical protein